ncbi:ParB/RepB/Spo0J family partition protein [Nocardioides sp. NPDC051685]|uniref:ParB/RepB/Spo0J family partition protein n=1 Tax=Nocardioides sp. NPDC051685 TaxID=3364334 RepID=UPI0037A61CC7
MTTTQKNTSKKAQATPEAYEAGTTVHVAPSSLLLERNIRTIPRDAAFTDLTRSITEVGVLEPIVAVTTTSGDLLVRFGERRTLAAIEAQRETVPVYVAGADSTAKDDEIARVIAQREENTHRVGLTTAEEIGVVGQLAAFGLSPAQIAKRTRIDKTTVETSLTVANSKMATKATERYDVLGLDQAAVVAEFEDDPEAVKALVLAAHEGQFDHTAQRLRDDRITDRLRVQVAAMLDECGITLIEEPGYNDPRISKISDLRVSAEDSTRITEEEHATCPGHVAWISNEYGYVDDQGNRVTHPARPTDRDAEDYEERQAAYQAEADRIRAECRRMPIPTAVFGCADWRANGHHDQFTASATRSKPKAADMSEEQRAEAAAARKLVIDNNKAWAATEPVRREWLATFAKSKTPPKGTAAFLATALCHDAEILHDRDANRLAATWLGKKEPEGYARADLSPAKSATDQRAYMAALVQVLAAHEVDIRDNSWRHDGTKNAVGRYLRFIASAGYGLSEVEKYAISAKTA